MAGQLADGMGAGEKRRGEKNRMKTNDRWKKGVREKEK